MICTNKLSLYYLYFKLRHSYKNLKNKSKDIKFLDLSRPQLETITAHIIFTTNHNIKLNQLYQIYLIEIWEKLNVTIVIPIVTIIRLLHRICIHLKMLKLRSYTKTGLSNLYCIIYLCYTTPLSTALRNIFINGEIYYIIIWYTRAHLSSM